MGNEIGTIAQAGLRLVPFAQGLRFSIRPSPTVFSAVLSGIIAWPIQSSCSTNEMARQHFCSEVITVGGATAGKITTVGSTSCTTIVTFGNTATAPNGWACFAHDLTTSVDYNNPHVSSTTTTATIVTGTIVSGDAIEFECHGY